MEIKKITALSRLIRYHIIRSTAVAGSGHVTSSLSAVELVAGLLFSGIFRADLKKPMLSNNDRLIFSKGHAAPLLYSTYAVAGALPAAKLSLLRHFGGPLEGHPMPKFPYTEAPTGSLGQGLGLGVGEALAAKMSHLNYRTHVLLGDSEMAEGSVWEAIQIATYQRLDNLVAVIDMNGLGQSGSTMLGCDYTAMAKRVKAFGWKVFVIDGHDLQQIIHAYAKATTVRGRPVMIIAKTIKGKGIKFLEGKQGWHGKVLDHDQAAQALMGLGSVDLEIRGQVNTPKHQQPIMTKRGVTQKSKYAVGDMISLRQAFGHALVHLATTFPQLVVLDAEVKNSTETQTFAEYYPEHFVEGFIAEQNAVSMAGGLAARGMIPVFATFAAFMTRAYDQLRMNQYAGTHQVFVGTHAGVHIGQDGASQMGLQDIAMFRTLENSVVLYPSDAVSAVALLEKSLRSQGMNYVRITRASLPVLYKPTQKFTIGGSHVLRSSSNDVATIVAAGVTVHEALKAADLLARKNMHVRVVDLYSIKPLDVVTLQKAVQETGRLIVVEDHYPEGGIAEAVRTALGKNSGCVRSLAVTKTPHSGKPEELLAYEGIDAGAIMQAVMKKS